MRLTWIAAAIAAAMSTAVPALAGGEWPDGPNKLWFESLQRPDNHLAPYRKLDRSRCSVAASPTPSKPSLRSSRATNAIPKIAGTLG